MAGMQDLQSYQPLSIAMTSGFSGNLAEPRSATQVPSIGLPANESAGAANSSSNIRFMTRTPL